MNNNIENNNNDEDNEKKFLDKIISRYTTKSFVPESKRQSAYLYLDDMDVAFNETKHIYSLPDKSLRFPISVTGFVKQNILNDRFDPVEIIRNTKVEECEYDVHADRLIEWKYASVFGSLFHAIIEFFFEDVVNDCYHVECENDAAFDMDSYYDYLLSETSRYYMDIGKCSQAYRVHDHLRFPPRMPCRHSVKYLDKFIAIIIDDNNFEAFLHNNHRFNINNECYISEIIRTMECAFDGRQRHKLPPQIIAYRENMLEYDIEIDKILQIHYTRGRCLIDLQHHLNSFRSVLIHLPLHAYFEIQPEYIVFNEERGLVGSVDLTMRSRSDPYKLAVYDWKTCKAIFTNLYRNGEKSTQLHNYACQLHTYANLIKCKDDRFDIDLFIVNVTHTDSCIYNVKDYTNCKCKDKFELFVQPMISIK